MKLFQNLYIGLAEEVVYNFFLFIALVAIFSTEQNGLSNFCEQSPKEHSCIIFFLKFFYFKALFYFSIFGSSGHLVQRSQMI